MNHLAKIDSWTSAIIAGDIRAIAKAATAIENRSPDAEQLLRSLWPHTGKAAILGITGPPGAGKSTYVSELVKLLRSEGGKVAVIAVDPTSPFSGGAVLGDRVRMQQHHADPGVFIRSMATRGHLGGLAPATMDLALLADAAGFDTVLIETVGVGQDEVEISALASATAVVLVPGMGDDVQAIKAGILEIADVFVINKSDLHGAAKLESELQMMLSLAHRPDNWVPPIVKTVASQRQGIEQSLLALRSFLSQGVAVDKAALRWAPRLAQMWKEKIGALISTQQIAEAAVKVANREQDPYEIIEDWQNQLFP